MVMYEARQNKEKVSRKIDGGDMTRQRVQLRDMRIAQRQTQIDYSTQVLHITDVGDWIVGKKMNALLDPRDPVKGSATNSTVQKGLMDRLGRAYLKGHLLNHDLGGLAIAANLFPITYAMNSQHNRMAEEPVKRSLYAGNTVYYTVEATNQETNFNSIDDFKARDYGFRWGADNNSYPQILHTQQINSHNTIRDDYKQEWNHGARSGLAERNSSDITNNTLSHSSIDNMDYFQNVLTISQHPFYHGLSNETERT